MEKRKPLAELLKDSPKAPPKAEDESGDEDMDMGMEDAMESLAGALKSGDFGAAAEAFRSASKLSGRGKKY